MRTNRDVLFRCRKEIPDIHTILYNNLFYFIAIKDTGSLQDAIINSMRVAFYTLGCKVNQFESAALAEGFSSRGAEIVPHTEEADIYIVNTCAVTSRAAYHSRRILRDLAMSRRGARIIATGCYAQIGAQEILDTVPGTPCLIGNDQKVHLVDLALDHRDCLEVYIGDISRVTAIAPFIARGQKERTRAFIRIQDGCDSFCTYCIIPYARGRSRSLPTDMVQRQIGILVQEGVKEVVIAGINVGRYGRDLSEGVCLLELLKRLCRLFPQVRFRLSSISPLELTPGMISWARSTPNFCPHWHIPLQSGSDTILALMNRHYTSSYYRDLIMELRRAMPDAAIGTDVLVGFPREDEAAFEETLSLISELPITYVHVFPFSPRPGTVAAAMGATVSKEDKAQRGRLIRDLGNEKKQAFYLSQVGKILKCLVERPERESGLWRGFTSNYIPTLIRSERGNDLRNEVLRVRIEKIEKGVAFARPI